MNQRPKRVLHVVRAMNRGGVETWLMNILRRLDRRRTQMDFLVHTQERCAYDPEILDRGSHLLRCSTAPWSAAYPLRIARLVCGAEPYDAIHSHVHHFSGYLLALARRLGVTCRIAHSHSDTSRADDRAGRLRRCYLARSKRWIRHNATRLVGVSRAAALALFGQSWEQDSRSLLMHCGIDLEPFRCDAGRAAARALWSISDDDFVIGHVGRFDAPKNHAFLLRIAAEAVRLHPRTRMLLVGDGPLKQSLEHAARDAGIGDKVVFTGARGDVPRMLAAMDVFVFPSLWEGLPLTLLEAQAAGLPCVRSEVITAETDVVPSLIQIRSLADDAKDWAKTALAAPGRSIPSRSQALSIVESSTFNISNSLEQLYALYNA